MGSIDFGKIAPVLKRAAREQGLTYRELGRALALSESAIKKTLNGRDCSLNRLARLCDVLDLDLPDLLKSADKPAVDTRELTLAQQRFLVRNHDALRVYWKCSAQRASVARIVKDLGLTRARVRELLRKLQHQGLLRFDGRRVIAPGLDHVVWGREGPLIDYVQRTLSANVLRIAASQTEQRGYRVSLRYFQLTAADVEEANLAITELLAGYERRARLGQQLGLGGRKDFSVLVATAPVSPL